MIYPTRLAVLCALAGAPIALAVATLAPGRWYAALAWPFAVLLLILLDALASRARASAEVVLPPSAALAAPLDVPVIVALAGRRPPHVAEVALSPDRLVTCADDGFARVDLLGGEGIGRFVLTPVRRGTALFPLLWVRWAGPLGLVWRQARIAGERRLAILPDIEAIRDRGAAIFERHAVLGLVAQADRGDGTDFHALVEYRAGMDRRAIDWKQSARFHKLHAKEFHSERNSQIVFAIDAGRQMTEPVAGMARIDRAVQGALLCGWVALKLGDRIALSAFDSRPRIASGFIGGAAAFAELQRLAATIDYSSEETNYTFALTTLAGRLTRRSMIVLFTEFTDLTSADFLVRAVARLMQKHLILIVVLRDEELEAIVAREPADAADVTRAVTAAALLRDRLLVLTRLRHLGAHVIESEHDRIGERLVHGYIDLKRRNLL
ncbi:MAG: DUF58 domain-containing protein [Candidatus Sphingomonas colombiensis]|nr:DUF58 domain-containing protein [Sphingomonas sp.]WEK44332.1 MAG: DUF58 domain-containing protein [Sphingomonas sp.]